MENMPDEKEMELSHIVSQLDSAEKLIHVGMGLTLEQ